MTIYHNCWYKDSKEQWPVQSGQTGAVRLTCAAEQCRTEVPMYWYIDIVHPGSRNMENASRKWQFWRNRCYMSSRGSMLLKHSDQLIVTTPTEASMCTYSHTHVHKATLTFWDFRATCWSDLLVNNVSLPANTSTKETQKEFSVRLRLSSLLSGFKDLIRADKAWKKMTAASPVSPLCGDYGVVGCGGLASVCFLQE